jgi:hypothetical protein
MWRCDPPTRVVVAIVAGLVAAAFGHPLVSLLAAIPWRPRPLLLAVALAAALWGGMRVAALQHRALVPGPIDGVVIVTGAPSGDRAVVRVAAGREDVLLQAPGYRPQLGGIYRVTGRLREIDPPVRDYYASQGVHLELRGSRLVWLAARGGGWSGACSTPCTATRCGVWARMAIRRPTGRSWPESRWARRARCQPTFAPSSARPGCITWLRCRDKTWRWS